jgi:hypothetical protein
VVSHVHLVIFFIFRKRHEAEFFLYFHKKFRMKISGNLNKMDAEISGKVIYYLSLGDNRIVMNELIGHEITLTNLHIINCIKCGRVTKTSFAQGFCYPCFITAPEAEDCVLRPELCRAHEGIARDMNFAAEHCLIDHFVYLAYSGGLKVGVTRHTQIPVRWIDQGAESATIIARTPNRYLAGTIEVALKNHLSDKTNWRVMLSGQNRDIDMLLQYKGNVLSLLHPDFRKFVVVDDIMTSIDYPVTEYPRKVKSINFDTIEEISDILIGIKGQYLLFKSGAVLNLRKHNGYLVKLEY